MMRIIQTQQALMRLINSKDNEDANYLEQNQRNDLPTQYQNPVTEHLNISLATVTLHPCFIHATPKFQTIKTEC